MNKIILAALSSSLALVACNGGGSSSSPAPAPTPAPIPQSQIPESYQCAPSALPSLNNSTLNSQLQLAYAGNCSVASAPQSNNLQQMAVALEFYIDNSLYQAPSSGYYNYCTGTPISYDPVSGVSFVVTAAHCVVGGNKAANTQVKTNNIITFNPSRYSGNLHNQAWIYQGTTANPLASQSQLSAQIQAVYIPAQYCQAPAFDVNGSGCKNSGLDQQNGDIAVLKVVNNSSHSLQASSLVQLPPQNLSLSSSSYLLALGYGGVIGDPSNGNLNYINYQYFGTDSYRGVNAQSSILNGYSLNNAYYSIICGGDSGGGDFYWNGSSWNLLGVHSFGVKGCGQAASWYSHAYDASADVRPFSNWIQNIVTNAASVAGCANLGASYVCQSGNAF